MDFQQHGSEHVKMLTPCHSHAIALLLLPVGCLWIRLAALLPGICIASGCCLAALERV
jgi:hypothetical protein